MTTTRRVHVRAFATLCVTALIVFGCLSPARAQRRYDLGTSGMRWRLLGPFRGGRVNAVSGVPGQPNTFYFGSVGGGALGRPSSIRSPSPPSEPSASRRRTPT